MPALSRNHFSLGMYRRGTSSCSSTHFRGLERDGAKQQNKSRCRWLPQNDSEAFVRFGKISKQSRPQPSFIYFCGESVRSFFRIKPKKDTTSKSRITFPKYKSHSTLICMDNQSLNLRIHCHEEQDLSGTGIFFKFHDPQECSLLVRTLRCSDRTAGSHNELGALSYSPARGHP